MTAALPAAVRPRLSWRQRLLRLLPWHRRLALLACVGLLGWGASGLLHVLAHVLQPRPATLAPPSAALALDGLRAPAAVLGAAGIEAVQELRLLQLEGQPYYQARLPGQAQPRYWHARSGVERALAGRHAEALARHYLGSAEPLAYAGSLERFAGEYGPMNRLLPVARVDSRRGDGLRLYLDLFHDRLGGLVDARKAWLGELFRALHGFHWLDAGGPLRLLLVLLLAGAAIAATLLGLGLFVARRRAPGALRRLHGWSGLALALATLSFAGSGAWHLLHKQRAAPLPAPFAARLAVAALDQAPAPHWQAAGAPLQQLGLIELDGAPAWRAQDAQGVRYLDRAGRPLPEETWRRYAEQRLAHYAQRLGLPGTPSPSLLQAFDGEYGFMSRRLPVFKAAYADPARTSLYVDPLDGALAGRVDDAERAEGWSFAQLHTGKFLGVFGHAGQQGLLGLLALSQVLLALVGLALLRRRPAPRPRAAHR